jgi:hypothetical protein
MKRFLMLCCTAVALMLSGATGTALAFNGGDHRGAGFHGGAGQMHNGMHNGGGHEARRGFHRGFHDFRGRGVIVIGGPFFWAPYYYDPGLYPAGTMYVAPSSDYSYYCNDPAGYYPEVSTCPTGWLRVVPGDVPY